MVISRNAKRARAIAIALVITFASNYAISYAAKSSVSKEAAENRDLLSTSRSGGNTNKPAPPISRELLSPGRSGGNTNKPAPPIS